MQVFGNSFRFELLKRFANSKCIGLREKVRHQLIMVRYDFRLVVHGCLSLSEAYKLSCDRAALMHELVEAVLTICARLSKNDRSSMDTLIKS